MRGYPGTAGMAKPRASGKKVLLKDGPEKTRRTWPRGRLLGRPSCARSSDMLGSAATRPAAATAPPRHHVQRRHHDELAVPLQRHAWRRPLRGGALSARAARVAQIVRAQVDRAEGPKRERIAPVLSSYRRDALKFLRGGKWPGAGRRGKLTEQRGPTAKKGGHV